MNVLADDSRTPARFLILGSASPDLVRGVSESLAGRIAFVDLDSLWVVHPGESSWPMAKDIEAVAFPDLLTRIQFIGSHSILFIGRP